jgi:hypothetical protein
MLRSRSARTQILLSYSSRMINYINCHDYTALTRSDRIFINTKLARVMEGVVMAYYKMSSEHVAEELRKTMENLRISGLLLKFGLKHL